MFNSGVVMAVRILKFLSSSEASTHVQEHIEACDKPKEYKAEMHMVLWRLTSFRFFHPRFPCISSLA